MVQHRRSLTLPADVGLLNMPARGVTDVADVPRGRQALWKILLGASELVVQYVVARHGQS